jgi:hypothetical protein
MRHRHYPQLRLGPPDDSPYGNAPAPIPPSPPAAPLADPGPGLPTPPPGGPNGNPPAAPAPPSGPATGPPAEAIQAAVQSALGPIQSELTALREENTALREGLTPPAAPPASAPASEDDFTQSLLTDPRGAVTSVVKDVFSQLAPFFNELSGTAHEAILEGHRGAIDTEFGPGTFQEEFTPILEKRFDTARKDNPALLASREWINSEINGIKGFKMNGLVERRSKAATARTEAERAEAERLLTHFNATNLTGGVRPGGDKPREPTPAEQAYLEARANSGHPTDLESLRRAQSSGSSLSEIKASLSREGE